MREGMPWKSLMRRARWMPGAAALLAAGMPALSPGAEIPTFYLSATMVGDANPPVLYFMTAEKTAKGGIRRSPERLKVQPYARGAGVEVPLLPPCELYVAPAGKPDDVAALKPEIRIPVESQKPGQRLLLLFYPDMTGKLRHVFLDDSEAAHPVGQVRFFNATGETVAFTVGAQPQAASPGADTLAQPVLDVRRRFPFKCVSKAKAALFKKLRPQSLAMPEEDSRLLIVYAPSARPARQTGGTTADEAEPERMVHAPKIFRLYDRLAAARPEGRLSRPVASSAGTSSASEMEIPSAAAPCEIVLVGLGGVPDGHRAHFVAGGLRKVGETIFEEGLARGSFPVGGERELEIQIEGRTLGPAALPDDSTEVVAFLPPERAAGAPDFFDNSLQSHPAGTVRVFNLTPFQVAFSVGGAIERISPKGDALPQIAADQESYVCKLAIQGDRGWMMLDESSRPIPRANQRTALFIYQDPGSGAFRTGEIAL